MIYQSKTLLSHCILRYQAVKIPRHQSKHSGYPVSSSLLCSLFNLAGCFSVFLMFIVGNLSYLFEPFLLRFCRFLGISQLELNIHNEVLQRWRKLCWHFWFTASLNKSFKSYIIQRSNLVHTLSISHLFYFDYICSVFAI